MGRDYAPPIGAARTLPAISEAERHGSRRTPPDEGGELEDAEVERVPRPEQRAKVGELLGRTADAGLRVVTCHLGAGASLTAVLGGRSVDTTMGFTPLEGLVMATRSGTVDPGLVLWLATEQQVPPAELTEALERRSGLLGLGGSADMRAILGAAQAGDDDARIALDVYVHRLRAAIAAMAASLGGLDAIAFTGGVGERSATVRALAAEGLGFLGFGLDAAANEGADGDAEAEITAAGAPVRAFVIPAREEVEIARGVRAALDLR